MEKARAAFATAERLDDVQIADVPGVRELLRVRAAADHDWQQTAVEMAKLGWWFQAFRGDDVAASVRAELAKERQAGAAEPAARRRAWEVLGGGDSGLRSERMVLQALERIVARRATIWDPRLDEVADAAEAMRAFWSEVAPALPKEDAAEGRTLVERVRAMGMRPASEPPELVAARSEIASLGDRRLTMAIVWHRVAAVCTEVQLHAQRAAERARDDKVKGDYRELAARCADVVAAIPLLLH